VPPGSSAATPPPYVIANPAVLHTYYLQPCAALRQPHCPQSWVRAPAVVQSWGGAELRPGTCAALGDAFSASCTATSRENVTCTFSGGDSGRRVRIEYACAEGEVEASAAEEMPLEYTVRFQGPAGCSTSRERKRGGGGGGWFAQSLQRFVQQGYLDEWTNTTTLVQALDSGVGEALLDLERQNPGVIAAVAVASSSAVCICCLLSCYLRSRLIRQARDFEERLRLVSANKELSVFDDEAAAYAEQSQLSTPSASEGVANGFRRAKPAAGPSFGDDDGL